MENSCDNSASDLQKRLRVKLKETIIDLLMLSDALNITSVVLTDLEENASRKIPKVDSNKIIFLSAFMDTGALTGFENYIKFYKDMITINPTDSIRRSYLQVIRKR